MKILLTGATGYIGQRLLPVLLQQGHEVICCVRDKGRFDVTPFDPNRVKVIELDFLNYESLHSIPEDINLAYYLMHSMSAETGNFEKLEKLAAENFRNRIQLTSVTQVIYLSGIVNNDKLSKHLSSRKDVENILSDSSFNLTTLKAGIIIGSGSASFEIIRDLVEKLPVMITPKWLNTLSQPIAVRNVLQFLSGVIADPYTYNQSFDLGGPDILSYKDILLKFAKVRKLKRRIFVVPVMTPKLSSYWLYFITSTNYKLAVNLVNSMKVEVICKENDLAKKLGIRLLTFEDSVRAAFDRIGQQHVLSSWTDAQSSNILDPGISSLEKVPEYGCFSDTRSKKLKQDNRALEKIWSLGGDNGWYYANWLWNLRGLIDKIAGGVGLRRGRRNDATINPGDSLDFWRVVYANKQEQRLLLYAEMKLPGEAWLEFKIRENTVLQTATFRPLGLWGRIYWYFLLPFHGIIFRGMINRIAQ
jgi:uncharacterized protein YbjT (DUF2867 family)